MFGMRCFTVKWRVTVHRRAFLSQVKACKGFTKNKAMANSTSHFRTESTFGRQLFIFSFSAEFRAAALTISLIDVRKQRQISFFLYPLTRRERYATCQYQHDSFIKILSRASSKVISLALECH